jgi:Spy/CpxP family protein refolding chaperone
MMIPKLGLMMLLTGAAGLAQQPPPPPQPTQPPAVQAPRQAPVTEAERRRLDDIQARRNRGETISPEDQRFAQEMRVRMNQAPRPAVAPLPAPRATRARTVQPLRPAEAVQPAQPARPPLERVLGVPGGKWWTRPDMAQRLSLTDDQTRKMDDTFQQYRLKLIDLNAAVQREETIMEPLVAAEQPDEAKIVAQIDKVAQARAELEKANARMLLGIRRLLTPEQWNKLKAEIPPLPLRAVRR